MSAIYLTEADEVLDGAELIGHQLRSDGEGLFPTALLLEFPCDLLQHAIDALDELEDVFLGVG